MTHEQQVEKIKKECAEAVVQIEADRVGCPIVWARADKIISVLTFLKETEGLDYIFLADLTAYDDLGSEFESSGRFVVVYNLLSPQYQLRIRVKVRVAEGQDIATATMLWESANWAEREVYDMFGIKFKEHPDLRRILMDIRWVGHPLRKDYPWRKYQLFTDAEPIPEHLLKDST